MKVEWKCWEGEKRSEGRGTRGEEAGGRGEEDRDLTLPWWMQKAWWEVARPSFVDRADES